MLDPETGVQLLASFIVSAAPSIGWKVERVIESRSTLSRYIHLVRDDSLVVVRLSDHRSKQQRWERGNGFGFFQIVVRNVARLAELPAYLSSWRSPSNG